MKLLQCPDHGNHDLRPDRKCERSRPPSGLGARQKYSMRGPGTTQVVEVALNLGKVARISPRFHQVRHTLVASTRCAVEPQFLRRRRADHVRRNGRRSCKGICTSCLYCNRTCSSCGQH